MSSSTPPPKDPYSRVDYRRLIRWRKRIAREEPFLRSLLDRAPEGSVLDVGCGTGEHVAFFADAGARAIGLDVSENMIEAAREHEAAGRGRFVAGEAADAPALLSNDLPFGLAICLGNMLPHILEDEDLERWIHSMHAILEPGGLLLVQLLNYTRILEREERNLPLNLRPAPLAGSDGADQDPDAQDPRREIVFMRLMRSEGDGRVLFFPTTLELDPDAEVPVRVVSSRRVPLRAWSAEELGQRLTRAGFGVELHGDMTQGAYVPSDSRDLVIVAQRGPRA